MYALIFEKIIYIEPDILFYEDMVIDYFIISLDFTINIC